MSKETPITVSSAFYVLGIATLLPWNFFITANSFWQYKLRNTTLGDEWNAPNVELTRLQVTFTPAFVIISNLVCLFSGFFTSAISKRVNERTRILASLILTLISMIIITLFTFINTDDWQEIFFWIVMIVNAFINMGMSILQASLYGTVGFFSPKCISALVSGQSVAGVVSSVAQILSLAIGREDPVTTAIIYFSLADVYLIISIWTYLRISRTNFYIEKIKVETDEKHQNMNIKIYLQVFKKIFWVGSMFAILFVVTLAVFPAVQVYITSIHSPSKWADVYFQPTITFLLFNLFDMLGRELTRWIIWPGEEGCLFYILTISRIVFIPLMLLCYGQNKTFPTIFDYDFYYIIINIAFGLSNGYIMTLALIFYPRLVKTEEVELAGTMVASLGAVGMVIGSFSSSGLVALWGPKTN